MAIRVVLIDDHQIVLDGLRSALRNEPDIELAGVSTSGREGLELVRSVCPDVAVLDVTMPDLVAKDAVKAMKKLRIMEGVPIVLFSSKDEKELAEAVATAGANGYIAKGLDHELVKGVERFMPRARARG